MCVGEAVGCRGHRGEGDVWPEAAVVLHGSSEGAWPLLVVVLLPCL